MREMESGTFVYINYSTVFAHDIELSIQAI